MMDRSWLDETNGDSVPTPLRLYPFATVPEPARFRLPARKPSIVVPLLIVVTIAIAAGIGLVALIR